MYYTSSLYQLHAQKTRFSESVSPFYVSSQPIALYQKPRRFVPAGWQIPLSNEIS